MTGDAAGPRRPRRQMLWGLLALLIIAAAWAAWRLRPLEADAVQPALQPMQRSLQFSGRVQTPARVGIGSTLTGRVEQVQVREGDAVAAGAPLLALEADELRATLAQARASLAQAQALSAAQRSVSRPSADAALAQAEASALAAERELVRTRELLAANFISAARLDEVQRGHDIARAQRDAARAQARANRRDGAEAANVEAQRQLALAAVNAAQARLEQATLRAPASGRVIVRDVEPGQIVQPGRALLTLSIDGPAELIANVDERFLGQLQMGQRARVLADAFPQQPFDATVLRLAPAVDAQRGAVDVHFALDGAAPDFLREDMTLSIEVITGERAAARVLPLRALRVAAGDADRAKVLVAEDGRARERELRLGLRTLDQAEVVAGLADGDLVLLDATLAPGSRVKPRLLNPMQALRAPGPGGGDGASTLTNAVSGGSGR